MDNNCVFALDMGGSYIKSALVRADGSIAGQPLVIAAASDGSLQAVRAGWRQTLAQLTAQAQTLGLCVQGVGISTPGPFDFAAGKSLMQQKYRAIYGLPIADELYALGLDSRLPVRFIQDANAFIAGEQLCGAAKGYSCCSGVTLGTGLGFTSIVENVLLTNGLGAPYIALYRQPYGNGILEDAISARGICNDYLRRAVQEDDGTITAKLVGQRANAGDQAAIATMHNLGSVLGSQIAYLLVHTRCRCLVLGGQISKDFDLFAQPLRESLREVTTLTAILPAAHPQDAALFGAAALYYQNTAISQE